MREHVQPLRRPQRQGRFAVEDPGERWSLPSFQDNDNFLRIGKKFIYIPKKWQRMKNDHDLLLRSTIIEIIDSIFVE